MCDRKLLCESGHPYHTFLKVFAEPACFTLTLSEDEAETICTCEVVPHTSCSDGGSCRVCPAAAPWAPQRGVGSSHHDGGSWARTISLNKTSSCSRLFCCFFRKKILHRGTFVFCCDHACLISSSLVAIPSSAW